MRFFSSPGLTIVAVCATLASAFTCPEEDIANTQCLGPKDCLYPDPENCNQFIHCEVNTDGITGRPTVKACPADLEWNDIKIECDWPVNSTCQHPLQEVEDTVSEVVPPSNGTPDYSFDCATAENTQGCMGKKGGGVECIYANPKSNDSYIQCTDGLAYIVECKSGEAYNDAIKACE